MIVVAGGGAAGGLAACLLAEAGRRPLLLEREAGPHHKVCGEFLSHEAGTLLRRAGLDLPALGAAPVRAVRLVHGRRVAESALPFQAHGLSRHALDEALLRRATILGAEVVRGRTVRAAGPGRRLTLDDGTLEPDALFLATGKHDLRGARRMAGRTRERLVGFKLHLSLAPAQRDELRGAVEVVVFRGGYAGLQMVENGHANLCLLVRTERLAEAGGTWDGLAEALCREVPLLSSRLQGSRALFPRPLAVAGVPYGFLHRPGPDDPAGVFRLGDQAAVIPSFSGDGVSIALHTAARAAEALLARRSAAQYHAALRRELRRQMAWASRLYAAGRLFPAATVAAARFHPGLLRQGARLTRVASA